MQVNSDPIRLAGANRSRFRHACAFFQNAEEEYHFLIPVVKEGIERGEKAFHIVNPQICDEHLHRLESAGIRVVEAKQKGQLEVQGWDETYLHEGHFDQDAMLKLIAEILQRGKLEGYPSTQLVAQMEWCQEDRPGVNDLIAYEARLNDILSRYDDVVICTYDVAKFGAGVMLDLLRTHPLMIIGGILHENPYFVPPDEFLRELSTRGDAT